MSGSELVIVGPMGGSHVGSSLARAAEALGLAHRVIDTAPAYEGPRLIRVLLWHAFGRRPLKRAAFSEYARRILLAARPRVVIAMGQAPLTQSVIRDLRSSGACLVNFATDDPFNPAHRGGWHLRNLPDYDVVFTPRHANVGDLRRLGCRKVRYLPFGCDEELQVQCEGGTPPPGCDVLFVGGADRDRARFFQAFAQFGLSTALAGQYWERYRRVGAQRLGYVASDEVARLTRAVPVNLCLVRRANRDGHVMRSFEIAACRGFMVAEDTPEHRALFGAEGNCVLYFRSAREAAEKCWWAVAHPQERRRMADAAHRLIRGGGNSYRDRLKTMLSVAAT